VNNKRSATLKPCSLTAVIPSASNGSQRRAKNALPYADAAKRWMAATMLSLMLGSRATCPAALGFLVAAPLYLVGIWKVYTSGFSILSVDKWIYLPYFLNREAGGLAVLSIILLVVKSGVFRTFQSMLAAVGKTALSNYLLTSILCQFLFLWGPWKLYGKLEYYQYNYVVLVIWMINFIGSTLWLRAFRFGPTEWVWRSLTYLKLQPLRINPSVPAS
jgi:uncharacterized membrane protein YeiB